MANLELFVASPELDGYALAVRNDWSYQIEREFVTEWEKEKYQETFGEELITKDHFFKWLCELHNCSEVSENQQENSHAQ